MRISECCQLRVSDLEFNRAPIVIHGGKGNNDRMTMLLHSLQTALKVRVEFVRLRHEYDIDQGGGLAS